MKRTPLRKVSKKRAKINSEYFAKRIEFIKRNPFCKVCARGGKRGDRTSDVHHMRGRFSKETLLDERFWLSVCRFHHNKIHNNPAWAMERGYTLSRNLG